MTTTLYIYGKSGIWDDVTSALKDLSTKINSELISSQSEDSDKDVQVPAPLSERMSEGTQSVRWIELPDLDDRAAQQLAASLSERVRSCCLRLSNLEEDTNTETLGLYHAGQKLAERTVVWPKRDHDSLSVISTRSEHRFKVLLVTDFPERLDSILSENAIHQGNQQNDQSEFPIYLPILNAETSWARLPGYRNLFSTMRAPDATPHRLNDLNRNIRFPEPQPLISIEAIHQPISTVFELECVCYGLPVDTIIKAFNDWMGCWGKAYRLPYIDASKPDYDMARYLIASLGMTLPSEMSIDQAWNTLYGVSDRIEVALQWPVEVDDPYGWANLDNSRFASMATATDVSGEQVIISRRVMLDRVQTDQSLIDSIQPALSKLPAGVYLEVAFPGKLAWYHRFSNDS